MSWNDDNTVPINDFNQETSLSVGLDDDDIEDFIPTSQPRSGQSFTSLESFANRKIEETIPGEEEFSMVEDTLPVSGNEVFSDSSDYIPDTEAKLKRKLDDILGSSEPACKKSLDVANSTDVKFSEDIFSTQASKVPCSPSIIDSQLSVVNETATETSNIFLPNEENDADVSKDILVSDASVTEIFDNDLSRETITLDSGKNSRILETQELSSDTDKNPKNESEIVDIDSPLRFMETSASLPVFNSQQVEDELQKSQDKKSDDAMTNDTIDANGVDYPPLSPFPQRCDTDLAIISKLPSLSNETSSNEKLSKKNSSSGSRKNMFKNLLSGELSSEVQKHSTPENQVSKIFNTDESASSIENLTPVTNDTNKKIDVSFHVKIECEIVLNSENKELISKKITNVVDLEKAKLMRRFAEPFHGTSSDSKRLSSSSAGSVYSDKAGLPYPLPRFSAATRRTESSGSTDDLEKAFKISGRKVWVNEYMLPMKMDEIFEQQLPKIRDMDDSNDSSKRKTPLSSKKPKSRRRMPPRMLSDVNESTNTEDFLSNPDMNISEQSSGLTDKEKNFTQGSSNPDMNLSEQSSGLTDKEKNSIQSLSNPEMNLSNQSNGLTDKEKNLTPKNSDSNVQESEKSDDDKKVGSKTLETVLEEPASEEKDSSEESRKGNVAAKEATVSESESEVESDLETDSDELKIGTSVFARWTDLNYYSGTLKEQTKMDRWSVKFDDGTTKVIRDDFIIPLKWIKEGELVFASIQNNYESGKIVKVNRGKSKEFTVELDETNLEVSVNRIDIRLTEVMVSIVKEKYQSVNNSTPKPKSIADINFDNVLSGKRNREFSTPTRAAAAQTGSSRKKDSTSRSTEPRTPARSSTKKTETPVGSRSTGRGRKAKVSNQSEDSSAVEDAETPVRSSKSKAKAKSLSSAFEKSAATASPLPVVPEEPVPGPSNVKKGRGRPKGVSFEPAKVESSSKKTDNNQLNPDENVVSVIETRKGKRKLKTTEVAETKSEEKSSIANKRARGCSKKSK